MVIYNRTNGKFIAGIYPKPIDAETISDQYLLKEDKNSGAALLFALLPTIMQDDEFNEYYQELKKHRDNGYTDIEEAVKTAAVLCDNIYRRLRYGTSLSTGGIPNDTPSNGAIPKLKPFAVQQGTYAPTNTLFGTFQVLIPGSTTKRNWEAIAKEDFVNKYVLSESRILTPQEELTVPTLEPWYIIPPEIKRICEHAKLTTNTISPMRNFLLRGPAGTGKTEGAKAIAAGLHLPYRCITCSANTEIFDLLGQILPDVDGKLSSLQSESPTRNTSFPITSSFFPLTGGLMISSSVRFSSTTPAAVLTRKGVRICTWSRPFWMTSS